MSEKQFPLERPQLPRYPDNDLASNLFSIRHAHIDLGFT